MPESFSTFPHFNSSLAGNHAVETVDTHVYKCKGLYLRIFLCVTTGAHLLNKMATLAFGSEICFILMTLIIMV